MSEIGAAVKVVDSHPCGWGSIPGKSCSFLIVSSSKVISLCIMCSDQHVKYWIPHGFWGLQFSYSKDLSLYFMCSDQHIKYWIPCGLPLTSSLLLSYHVKQYTPTKKPRNKCAFRHIHFSDAFTNLVSTRNYRSYRNGNFCKGT